ncbi:MAG: hypothetical protein EZS28_015755 [Streblomastix strix]|uniref:Uncharacterized protein n=1 Tax=Streblomastix strix TaxID=222440 RepID=A0A5J4W1G6_9EUKA|nr:MAG: hypothetical protein EZS28_015755 [Streblomastix strix]
MSETKEATIIEDTNDRTGTRALFVRRLPQLATIINPDRTDEDKSDVKTLIFDIKSKPEENPTPEAQIIKKMTLIFSNQSLNSNESFYAWAAIYINGLNQLKKELCLLAEHNTQAMKDKCLQWFNKIQLPPNDQQFSDVKSGGAFALAKTIEGKLWSFGMKQDGSWDSYNDSWIENPHFNSENGLIASSLGPSKIRQFSFELHLAIIILENGAVFAYGPLHDYQSYPDIPDNGFIELTDSSKMKYLFVDEIRGSVSRSEGQYGIFGTHHVVKYFRKANAFLSSDGIVIIKTYLESEKRYKYRFTPIDPQFFQSEKIIHINSHIYDAYVTESGRVIVTRGVYKEAHELFVELQKPQKILQLPFPINQLKTLILTNKQHLTALNKDGSILSIRIEDGIIRDATDYVNELVNSDLKGTKMKIKHFGQVSMQFYFLFE